MKLRTSFFNPAAFRKDLTRFAPAWVLYTVGLFMVLSVCMIDNSEYYRAQSLAYSLSFMAAVNLCYGLLNGQLLFGDLFNARHCNALHAMHLRRECWYVTHITAGLLFSLVPNVLMSLVALVMLGTGWPVALWWLLAVTLQYLFFFSLAVFAALCVGNRFAMVLVYGIVNFFSLIVYWFYQSIYEPLLYGIHVTAEPFTRLCPVWTMIENDELIAVVQFDGGEYMDWTVKAVSRGEGWGYLAICAAIGVALLAVTLLLYRRRKLESAGDFIAVKAMEPVFLVLYTLSMAAFFQVFAELFGMEEYIFLALGLAIGFFTGRMLLMRTTKVFQPKGFLRFGILAGIFVLSMVLTWLDPIGVTRYIPAAADIRSARLSTYYNPANDSTPAMTEEENIENLRRLHQMILDGQVNVERDDPDGNYSVTRLSFYYTLDSGITVSRSYEMVMTESPAGRLAEEFFTRPEYVLGGDVDTIVDTLEYMNYYAYASDLGGQLELSDEVARGLLQAIEADCAEGNMAQDWGYHDDEEVVGNLDFECRVPTTGYYDYHSIQIFESCRHTVAYLEEYILPTLG